MIFQNPQLSRPNPKNTSKIEHASTRWIWSVIKKNWSAHQIHNFWNHPPVHSLIQFGKTSPQKNTESVACGPLNSNLSDESDLASAESFWLPLNLSPPTPKNHFTAILPGDFPTSISQTDYDISLNNV